MIRTILKEFPIPTIVAGTQHHITHNGSTLEESSLKKFVPFVGVSVLNDSDEAIKISFNGSVDNCIRLPANSSRSITGYPIYEATVHNLGALDIPTDKVFVTFINDFEQVSRFNASEKQKGNY